jgi:hypothetical protein
MEVSPNALRKETVQTLSEIEKVILSIRQEAAIAGVDASKFRDTNGNWVLAPLLVAKAQCLDTLVRLNEATKRR